MHRSFYTLIGGMLLTCGAIDAKAARTHELESYRQESSDEEAFLIRRIAEFWKDGDYKIVKEQIHQFLSKYPKSALNDYLLGILGDLYLQEAKYDKSISLYEQIRDPSVYEKIVINKMQCYYELNQYDEIVDEGRYYVSKHGNNFQDRHDEFNFLMGEGFFRQALTSKDKIATRDLVTHARPYYELLLASEYADVSSFALAEIYRLQDEHAMGSALYLELAKKHKDKREHLLFNAAVLQAHLDKGKAAALFDEIIDMRGEKANEASYNRLLLAFQTEQYKYVIENHRTIYPYVPEEQVALFNFIVGKSFFAVEDYQNAALPITKFLAANPEKGNQYKDALLIQMTCSKELGDEPLFNSALEKYEMAYPNDPELSKAYFMHAMMCKAEGQHDKVEEKLAVIMRTYPNFEDQESLIYEYGVAAHKNNHWHESYDLFHTYLAQFPSSDRTESSWRYFLSTCLNLSKANDKQYSKVKFLSDLNTVLSSKNGLNSEEMREYRLLYSKLSYELGYHKAVLDQLSQYIADYPNHHSVAEAHLISAMSLNQLDQNLSAYCDHLEQAIELNPEMYDNSSVHLQLYNGYITLADEGHASDELRERAAEHLYLASRNPEQEIRFENRIWLAGNYYTKVKTVLEQGGEVTSEEDVQTAFDRSLELYADAFKRQPIDYAHRDLEPEVLKYADLLTYKNDREQKLTMLSSLIDLQNANQNIEWKFRRQALYELAKTHQVLGENNKALETYQFILQEANGVTTPITNSSALQIALIKYNNIPETGRNESNAEVLDVLNRLKELQIRKSVDSEPTHLEAALQYAKIRSELSDPDRRNARYLFFLVRMKEDYASDDDLINRDYHTALSQHPDKLKLFEGYMKFVDGEIMRMQSIQLQKENNREQALKYQKNATLIFTELLEENTSLSTLDLHITKSVKAIERSRLR
ncbi:MAG: hypothetical protein P0S94_00410 [Simkaniaceae bacterium]|nr:hypothetical protein [Simkaniaceae bacterium]